jgi:hypothetical protein
MFWLNAVLAEQLQATRLACVTLQCPLEVSLSRGARGSHPNIVCRWRSQGEQQLNGNAGATALTDR